MTIGEIREARRHTEALIRLDIDRRLRKLQERTGTKVSSLSVTGTVEMDGHAVKKLSVDKVKVGIDL